MANKYEFLLSRAIFLPQTLFTKQCKTGDMQEKYRFFLYPSISAEIELENWERSPIYLRSEELWTLSEVAMPGALRDELIIPSCPGPTILHKPHSLPPTPLNMLQNPSHSLYKNIRTSTQWSQIIDRNKVCVQRTKNGVSEAFLCSGRGGEGGGRGLILNEN